MGRALVVDKFDPSKFRELRRRAFSRALHLAQVIGREYGRSVAENRILRVENGRTTIPMDLLEVCLKAISRKLRRSVRISEVMSDSHVEVSNEFTTRETKSEAPAP